MNPSPDVLIDGLPCHQIDCADRGLHYGDGLFETIAVKAGLPRHWERHMARLREGCERLGLVMPAAQLLRAEVERLCSRQGDTPCVIKIILTRGSAGRGYRPQMPAEPRRMVARYPWPDYPAEFWQQGVRVRLCRTPLALNPVLAGIKHLNRLEQVMARAEWNDADTAEGVMCGTDGLVYEGTMSNIFMVRNGVLYTPDLQRGGVCGIMREVVLDKAAELGIAVRKALITPAQLAQADEIFVTNSIIGIWPVKHYQGRAFEPGGLTRRIQAAVEQAALEEERK